MNKNLKGFAAIHFALILIIVVFIAGVGWYVFSSNRSKNDSLNNTAKLQKSASSAAKKTDINQTDIKVVNVINPNESVSNLPISEVAKTKDQNEILEALHASCKDNNYKNITVNYQVFSPGGVGLYKQEGNYAFINARSCDKTVSKLDELSGSGSAIFLHKNNGGKWQIDTTTQMEVECSNVDGKGYPAFIISKCMDSATSTERSPK
jgi:uncharacterized protein (UPF0333 family)